MIEKLLKIAYNEVGYLEKASNDCLDEKTSNAGDGNYTKYARDLFSYLQGYSWCCMFVYWCFYQLYGLTTKYIIGEKTAKCSTLKYHMQDIGCIEIKKPQKGDLVFFKNADNEICHIGIVYSIGKDTFSTIEGNTIRGIDNVVSNGGGVFIRAYRYDNQRIDSFVRPKWNEKEEIKIDIEEKLARMSKSWQECQKVGIVKLQNPKSYLNIRKQPSTDSQVIGTLNHNEELKIVEDMNGWYKVQAGSMTGYCSKTYIVIKKQ